MDNKIYFEKELSSYNFYTNIIKQFYSIYKTNSNMSPILDFQNTEYIYPEAVPVLLSFGDYLKRLYGKPIQVLYEKGSNLQNFFAFINFYEISRKLGIFLWDNDMFMNWQGRELRDVHKMSFTYASYSDADKIKDPIQKRNYIFDCLLDRTKVVYKTILNDTNQLPEIIIESTLNAIAEIETNAVMYSQSHSFTFVASNKYGTRISVADSGIGFQKSFIKSSKKLEMVKIFYDIDRRFKNYLIIMSALNYSFVKHKEDSRENLWTLKTNVVKNNGTLKIQYGNTQIIFSHNRCGKCNKNEGLDNISACVNCLLKDYNTSSYSPIKIFQIGFQGVRVEAVIERKDQR